MVRVVAGRMEDGDADEAAGVHYYNVHQQTKKHKPTKRRRRRNKEKLTIGMPHIRQELHRRRSERIVLGELELGGEDAPLKGRVLGALDQTLPVEEVVLGDGAGGDAVGGVVGEGAVLLEEPAVGG